MTCNSLSFLQNHYFLLPNDRDGVSVIWFFLPPMCWGVRGEHLLYFSRRASARSSCPATIDPFAAILVTHPTVGELSLNKPQCACNKLGHTSSMTKKRNRRPANSRSELLMRPFGFCCVTKSALMSSGHLTRNTVGRHSLFSPTIIPPTPCPEASLTPM